MSSSHEHSSSLDEKVVPASSGAVPRPSTTANAADAPPAYHVATQSGITKVKAIQRVWGPRSKICLWVGVALAAYIYSLDGTTTYQYQAKATSSFSAHSLLGAVGTAQAIVLATMKPVAAKVSDTFGRAEAYALAVLFYVLGYIVVASSTDINAYAAGDVTSMRWRGVISSAVSLPFFINAFVSSNIAGAILAKAGWRWGYGQDHFQSAVLLRLTSLTQNVRNLILTLFWAQRRAKQMGVSATNYGDNDDVVLAKINMGVGLNRRQKIAAVWKRFIGHLVDLDAFGLLMFAAGWTCLLLPLTLVNGGKTTWKSHSIIAMLVVGPIILVAFIFYEGYYAKKPVFPLRLFKNKTIIAAALIGFFDFVSFSYQYSFIAVVHSDWSVVNQGYFALSLTFFAVMAGFIQFYTRRTKWLLVGGLCIRLLGVGLMIKSRGAHGSTGFLVITQVLQGMGGGIASCSCQLLAQASVPHQDLSTVTAFVLLFAEIGISAAIWRGHMPGLLAKNLDGLLNSTAIDGIYGSIYTAASYPRGSPIYEGVVSAYSETMKVLLIAATCIAVVPVFLSFAVSDIYLSDAHNAVEGEDLAGRPLDDHSDDKDSHRAR
ncbi:hypothetical protein RQP46_004946 [Phenoliferia psychrophenolica]